MTDKPNDSITPQQAGAKPAREEPAAPAPRKAARRPESEDPEQRREFFNDAMREALAPFAGMLERKITPFLAALEAIPDDAERLAKVSLPQFENRAALDQPSYQPTAPANWPLGPGAAEPERFLRPPGALPAGEFESVCSRCGKCVDVCPAGAIRIDPGYMKADGLPHIVARQQPCVVCNSLACTTHCPSGALRPLERLQIRMGTARVERDLCRRESGEECRLCVEACPVTGEGAPEGMAALVIHEATGRVRVRKNLCIGCGLCEARCPTEPAAIVVEPFKPVIDPIIS